MKLNFSWENGATGLFPMCALDGVEVGGVSPISCLLMDDGGLGVVSSVEWIDRGLEVASSVIDGTKDFGEWDREDWGTRIGPRTTEIYSLHDEGCAESVETVSFYKALDAWRNFIAYPLDTDAVLSVDV
jgi:hypothetical protein